MCLRWGDAVPQFLLAHPRAVGGKSLPKPKSLGRRCSACPPELAPLVPTGSSRQQDSAASLNTGQKS